MTYKKTALLLTFFAFILCFSVQNVAAQTSPKDDLIIPESSIFDVTTPSKATNNETSGEILETHPMLRLTPDKSELIRLNKEAVSVIVGNPAHLSVLLDTPEVVVLIPRAPGATHFSVLDRNSNVIMQRHVIVASPKQDYIRVRRSCVNADQGSGCNATSVYFCPDMCHEVNVTQIESDQENASDIPQATPEGPLPTDAPEQ